MDGNECDILREGMFFQTIITMVAYIDMTMEYQFQGQASTGPLLCHYWKSWNAIVEVK